MRAVTHGNASGGFRYSIRPRLGESFTEEMWPRIAALLQKYDEEVRAEFTPRIVTSIPPRLRELRLASGMPDTMTMAEANQNHHHEVNTRMARDMNFIYTREEIGPIGKG